MLRLMQLMQCFRIPIIGGLHTLVRAINKAEVNYSTVEKELLAIVWPETHFRPYLYGRKFQIIRDHRPLVYLFIYYQLILNDFHLLRGYASVNFMYSNINRHYFWKNLREDILKFVRKCDNL